MLAGGLIFVPRLLTRDARDTANQADAGFGWSSVRFHDLVN